MAFGMLAGPHFIGGAGYGYAVMDTSWWIVLAIIVLLEANALFGKQGPMTTVRGVITSSIVLTAVMVFVLEML
mgnify:CR=1 FL=1